MHLKNKFTFERQITINRKFILIVCAVLVLISGLSIFIALRISRRADSSQATVSVQGVTTVNAGQKVTLPVVIDTKGQNINAAEVYLNYNPRLVRIDEITKDGSFFKIWISDEPKFSNESGTISFAGGLPKPGFTGKGQIGTITITLLQNQDAQLVFTPKTRVLLNDGKATAIPLTMDPITIKVK